MQSTSVPLQELSASPHHDASDDKKLDAPSIKQVDIPDEEPAAAPQLQRRLKSRHMQMLAIGGIIGPGYFVGMGNGLVNGGPAGLLIGFSVVGMLLWCVMQSLAEMAAFIAVPGSFTIYAERFIDPAFSFALGWNYAFLWFGILAAEYNNLGLVMTYWPSAMPGWGFIIIFWFFFLFFSYLGVLAFGEAEFYLTLAKVLFILAFFLSAILLTSGAIGTGGPIGFSYYHNPGAFADGVVGTFKVFVFAALQYSGTEMIGLTAGESANPARDVPKAVRFVFWRVLIIFIGGVFFLSLVVPYDDPMLLGGTSKTARSPFAIAFVRRGLERGGDAINVIIIVTIVSALNGALYVTSRTIAAMANNGLAPKFLGVINKRGVPWAALAFANAFGFLALLNLSSSAGEVYQWLVNITGVATFITWGCICFCHIRFRRALKLQGIAVDDLPYRAAFWPYGAYIGLGGNLFFIFFQGWSVFCEFGFLLSADSVPPFSVKEFYKNYMMIGVFIIMAGAYKLVKKTKIADLQTVDLVSGRREVSSTPEDEVRQRNWLRRLKNETIG